MNNIEYLGDCLDKYVTLHISNNKKNPLKAAITSTLDEVFELLNSNETRYRDIDASAKSYLGNGIDDYFSATQLMLELVAIRISTGIFAKNNPDTMSQLWCSWYADIVVNAYAEAMRDKFNLLTGMYKDGNEFLGHSLMGEDGLNLSYIERRYKKEFNL